MQPERVKPQSKFEQFLVMDLPKLAVPVMLLMFMVAILFMGGCTSTPYVEVGLGPNTSLFQQNPRYEWDNANALGTTFEAGVEWDVNNNPNIKTKCRWLHVSQLTAGPPFNDRGESSLDHFGCAARYEFK